MKGIDPQQTVFHTIDKTIKEYRKYALLESKQYQNIPRTIQNVLLNAELKAEFRVQSISSSTSYTFKDVEGKKYFELKKGDELIISSVFEMQEKQTIEINGEVLNPGSFSYIKKMSLLDAVQLAGGFRGKPLIEY